MTKTLPNINKIRCKNCDTVLIIVKETNKVLDTWICKLCGKVQEGYVTSRDDINN